jgi:hypothetical protein
VWQGCRFGCSLVAMRALALVAVLTCSSLAVPTAGLAGEGASDFERIYADFQGTDNTAANDIQACRWTRQQLANARQQALQSPDFSAYYTAFVDELDREIQNHDSGYCRGVAPDPSGGSANPERDFQRVFRDWQPDGVVTPCAFTRRELQSALNVAAQVGDFDAYAPGFRDAVRREIQRIDAGGCAGLGKRSKLRIKRIRGKVRPGRSKKREYVVIRNAGTAAAGLQGVTLRDKAGKRIRLPRFTLRPKRSLRVNTRCLAKRKRPARRGHRFFACRKRQLWNDRGDVVKIVNPQGLVLAQRGFGRFKGVPRF